MDNNNVPPSLTLSNNGDEDVEKDMDIQLWENQDCFDMDLSPYQATKEICNDALAREEGLLYDDLSHGIIDDQGYVADVQKQNDERGAYVILCVTIHEVVMVWFRFTTGEPHILNHNGRTTVSHNGRTTVSHNGRNTVNHNGFGTQ
ncbi:hypothetical protein L6452_33060 [Arctium lappa]|uniref:Uncharacterized protein n=1 Tax=Arctium lappa TaxID=4217 RepID=A0ACB8Z791_ARCLA|nr:hypothetical protein L6452_33060 [Arctium lappa]